MTKIQVNSQGKAYLTTAGKALAGVQPTLVTKSITENGTYNASSDNADGYSSVTVNVSGGGSAKYGCTIDDIIGDTNSSGVLQTPSVKHSDIIFSGVTGLSLDALAYAFYGKTKIKSAVSFPDLTSITYMTSLAYSFGNSGIVSVSFPELTTIGGMMSCASAFYSCYSLNSISLPKLTTISDMQSCYQMFSGNSATSIEFPLLATISGQQACAYMFSACMSLTSMSLPKLATISGTNGAQSMFASCMALTSMSFPELVDLSGSSCCGYMFSGCSALTSISFPKLTTSSFGSYVNQFANMFNSSTASTSGAFTMHFPSNLSSTISGLTGYPNFGASSGRLTLAFDLPATT